MALKAIVNEAEEKGEQKSPLSLVFDEVNRIQSLGAACLALAEKEDLPSTFTDLVGLMIEQAALIEDRLEAAEA